MDGASLISKPLFLGVSIGTFSLAILTFIARSIIRLRASSRFQPDDYILLFAVCALIAAFTIVNISVDNVYYLNAFMHGMAPFPSNFVAFVNTIWIYGATGNILCWTAVFAVKFSFLALFWPLIWPSRRLQTLWWLSFVLCVLVFITRVFMPFVACPYSGFEVTKCALRSEFLQRQAYAIWWSVASDIATDLLIVLIPLCLLWQTQLSIKQKLSVGVILCLSTVMILIAILRAVSARLYGTRDQVWNMFWIQLEANISITMVSLTAFRQLFVAMKNANSTENRGRTYNTSRYRVQDTEEEAAENLTRKRSLGGLESFVFIDTLPPKAVIRDGRSEELNQPSRAHRIREAESIEMLPVESHYTAIGLAI